MSETPAQPPAQEPEDPQFGQLPPLLLIFCALGYIQYFWFLMSMPSIGDDMVERFGEHFPPLSFLLQTIQVIGYAGIWMMRKWGLYIFIAGTLALTGFHIFNGYILLRFMVPPFFVAFSAMLYSPRMR